MRLLVTGAGGMVGRALLELGAARHVMLGRTHRELDVADLAAVRGALAAARPDALLHVGAYTNVDGCETDPDLAYRVNALGTRNCAIAAAQRRIPILYVSTDYVFPGDGDVPYLEFDDVGPQSVYGRSKLAGERFVTQIAGERAWIVRTQWIYGFHGKNFVDTILAAAAAGKPLTVVDDQIGCPTYAGDLAAALLRIVDEDPGQGVIHCSSGGQASWYDLAKAALEIAGVTPASLAPMSSAMLDRPAKRPAFSVLRNFVLEQTLGDPMPDWKRGLEAYLMARRARG
jgi:dTDP-4-dehydrorhamnose reductase